MLFSKQTNERTGLFGKYLRLESDNQAAPMSAIDGDRHGEVVHDLTCVPYICLKQHGRSIRCPAFVARKLNSILIKRQIIAITRRPAMSSAMHHSTIEPTCPVFLRWEAALMIPKSRIIKTDDTDNWTRTIEAMEDTARLMLD